MWGPQATVGVDFEQKLLRVIWMREKIKNCYS